MSSPDNVWCRFINQCFINLIKLIFEQVVWILCYVHECQTSYKMQSKHFIFNCLFETP